jgi:DNA repair protein RadC
MTGPIWRVRELDIRYKSVRLPMPVGVVSGDIRGPHDAARLAAAVLADATVEKVIALHVNTKHRLIGVHVVSVGTLNASLVHPRDVFKGALLANAAGLILAHNHPSGDPTPSPDDRALVSRLLQAGELLGVELLDALIVVDPSEGGAYYSFKEAGALR